LRPMPFAYPEDLVDLKHLHVRTGPGPVFYGDLEDFRSQARSFDGMAAYQVISRNLVDVPDPERLTATSGERSLLRILGVSPLLGRTFREDDPPNVVVLSAALWKRRFSADPACIGRTIMLDGLPTTIIGVMPADFRFPVRASATDMWVPWRMEPGANRGRRVDSVIARVRHGVSFASAQAELVGIAAQLAQQYPDN